MKAVYLFPFLYSYCTRLRRASLAFHALFEWTAAALLVVVLGKDAPAHDILQAIVIYIAFISLYEIGYLANDIVASRESDGRARIPPRTSSSWIAAWIIVRIAVFLLMTFLLSMQSSAAWWSFFAALCIVFALHNFFIDREFRSATFLWLAWLRFMAPVIFLIDDRYRMGVAFAAAISYVVFRLFGYLDSKGMLRMRGRRRMEFRLVFFALPLAGAIALGPYPEARGFALLVGYYAVLALLGTCVYKLRASGVHPANDG